MITLSYSNGDIEYLYKQYIAHNIIDKKILRYFITVIDESVIIILSITFLHHC